MAREIPGRHHRRLSAYRKNALKTAAQLERETFDHRRPIAKKYLSTSFKESVESRFFLRPLENHRRK
jgi:hypothetical protein